MACVYKCRDIRRGRREGFTLIEVVAILVFTSLIGLLVFRGGGSSDAALSTEADMVRSHLRYAQAVAMANNLDAWGLSVTSSGYTLTRNGVTAAIQLPGLGAASHVFPAGIQVTQGAGTIVFDELGSPGAGDVTITLSDGSNTHVVRMEGGTGEQS